MPSLRAHLVALVLAVLLPSLALGGATAWHLAQSHRRTFEERLSDTTRALALAANAELGAVVAAVETLAASPLLDGPGDLAAFDVQARRAAAVFGSSWVVVTRAADLQQVVNTRVPPGTPLPRASSPEAISDTLRQRRPIVRDLVSLPFRSEPTVAVLAPVLREGGQPPAAVVAMPFDPARMARLLEEQGLPGDAFATIADGRGAVVARSPDHPRFLTRRVPDWYPAAVAGRDRGLLHGRAIDGRAMIFAFERLKAAPRWTVVVAETAAAHRAAWLDPLLSLAFGGIAALALAVALAAALAQRLLRPAVSLLRRAEAVAAGKPLPPATGEPSSVAEFEALRAAVERADAALRTGEAEFRAAFEQSALPMVQSDYATGRYVRVNDAFCRLVGRPAGAVLGHHFAEFTHPDDLPGQRAAIRRVTRREAASYEVVKRVVLPDGGVRWVRVSSSPVRDAAGRPIRTVAMLQDITESRAAAAALRESEARLRLAIEAARFGTWEFDLRRGTGSRAGRIAAEFPGVPATGFAFADWLRNIHPHDRAAVEQAFAATAEDRAPHFSAEFRVRRPDGSWAWIASHGAAVARDPATGAPVRIAGVAQDVTGRRMAEERQALLAREVDHRAKNALAVVQATLRLTPKDDPVAYARAVEGRVAALARAHTLLAEGRWEGAALRALVEGELAPFRPLSEAQAAAAERPPSSDGGGGAGGAGHGGPQPDAPAASPPPPRVEIDGPPLTLAPAAAQALSMAFHELATNATKYGALSVPGGRVAVTWRLDPAAGLLRLRWAESGGPPVPTPPTRRGFGSRVIEATVKDQLGGHVERRWAATGLVCDAEVPLGRVLAGSGTSGQPPAD